MATTIDAVSSPGCADAASTLRRGTLLDRTLPPLPPATQSTTYRLSLPADYTPSVAAPLLLSMHGWGMGLDDSNDLHRYGINHGFIVASPLGYDEGSMYSSWNGAGTTHVTRATDSAGGGGGGGTSCSIFDANRFEPLCYPSCGNCSDSPCSWTTCYDSVAQVVQLLDVLLDTLCVDVSRVFATGESNGGIFLYELARDARTASRFAGFAPVIGSPHANFAAAPLVVPAPFLALRGRFDTTVPPGNGSSDVVLDSDQPGVVAWRFRSADQVAHAWANANGCRGNAAQLAPPPGAHAAKQATCTGWNISSCNGGAEVVSCLFNGGHEIPHFRAQAIHEFMLRHSAPISRLPSARPRGASGADVVSIADGVAFVAVPLVFLAALVCACAFSTMRSHRRKHDGLLSTLRQRGIVVNQRAMHSAVELPMERVGSG